jgi:hypothetical protein
MPFVSVLVEVWMGRGKREGGKGKGERRKGGKEVFLKRVNFR